MVGGRKKVFRYLWNPPAGRHQKTAYLSATLMSSNRPGTVVNTQEEHLSHTPAAEDLAASRCGSPDCHKKLGVCDVQILLMRAETVVTLARSPQNGLIVLKVRNKGEKKS